jgi:hypothetical protein
MVPFFLDLFQECCTIFCVMVCCVTVHTCGWWKWKLPCIVSLLLAVMAHYWSRASSKSSSRSSSSSTSISSRCVVLRYLVILRRVILWLCIIVLQLRIFIIMMRISVWWWYLVELRCILSCHNLFLHPIGI